MNEPEFAKLARQYIKFLDCQHDMKPASWSQEDHSREVAWRNDLLDKMRAALASS